MYQKHKNTFKNLCVQFPWDQIPYLSPWVGTTLAAPPCPGTGSAAPPVGSGNT